MRDAQGIELGSATQNQPIILCNFRASSCGYRQAGIALSKLSTENLKKSAKLLKIKDLGSPEFANQREKKRASGPRECPLRAMSMYWNPDKYS
jgi:hypothetical protein